MPQYQLITVVPEMIEYFMANCVNRMYSIYELLQEYRKIENEEIVSDLSISSEQGIYLETLTQAMLQYPIPLGDFKLMSPPTSEEESIVDMFTMNGELPADFIRDLYQIAQGLVKKNSVTFLTVDYMETYRQTAIDQLEKQDYALDSILKTELSSFKPHDSIVFESGQASAYVSKMMAIDPSALIDHEGDVK